MLTGNHSRHAKVDFELGLTRKMLAGKMNYTRQDISKMRKEYVVGLHM